MERLIGTLDSEDLDNIKGKPSQRGVGSHTLCGRCNGNTGSWYGNAYKTWAMQGMELAQYAIEAPSIALTFRIHPLQVLKQIVCMFMSTNGSDFRNHHPDLVKFVLDPREQFIRPSSRIYTYFSLGPRMRQSGMVSSGEFSTGKIAAFSEMAFPPFGYVLSPNDTIPDQRLVDITWFKDSCKSDWGEIHLKLPVLPIYTWIPGDYRDRESVIRDMASSK